MKIKQLVSHIAKFEGKKHEASVGDIKEIVGIISDLIYIESITEERLSELVFALYSSGERRAKKKGKKS